MLAGKPGQGLNFVCGVITQHQTDPTEPQMAQVLDAPHPHPWGHGINEKWDFNAFWGY